MNPFFLIPARVWQAVFAGTGMLLTVGPLVDMVRKEPGPMDPKRHRLAALSS